MKLVPIEGVVVVRDNKRHVPPIGKAFDFTKEEVAYLRANRPEAIRAPINEGGDEAEVDEAEVVETPAKTAAAPKADDDL